MLDEPDKINNVFRNGEVIHHKKSQKVYCSQNFNMMHSAAIQPGQYCPLLGVVRFWMGGTKVYET